jgi:hypothetical protein
MRLALTAVIVCFGLLAWALQPAASQSVATSAQAVDASLESQSQAAEKHAKRTACLRDAKSKRLVGAQKTAFVKECMAANAQPQGSTSLVPSQSVPAPE